MALSLTESRKKYLKESIEMRMTAAFQKRADLEALLKEIDTEITEAQTMLDELDDTTTVKEIQSIPQSSFNGYPKEGSWAKKAAYIISKIGKPLTTREIAEYIHKMYEPKITVRELVPKLSVPLTTTKSFDKKERETGEYEFDVI